VNSVDWIAVIGIAVATVTAIIIAQRKNIEGLVGKRLDGLQEGVSELNAKSDNHGNRITRVETVLQLNGCFEGESFCDRRKDDR